MPGSLILIIVGAALIMIGFAGVGQTLLWVGAIVVIVGVVIGLADRRGPT